MNYKEAFKILIIVAIIIMPSIMYLSFRSGDHGRNINTIITEQAHQRTMLEELSDRADRADERTLNLMQAIPVDGKHCWDCHKQGWR